MRYLNAVTVMGLMAMQAAQDAGPPLRLAPKAQPPAKPSSNRKAKALEAALRRRARWDRQ